MNKLNPEDVDKLGDALIALTQELWVLRDRQIMLEAKLEEAGVMNREELDRMQPDDVLTGELSEQRQQLIANVLSALGVESSR